MGRTLVCICETMDHKDADSILACVHRSRRTVQSIRARFPRSPGFQYRLHIQLAVDDCFQFSLLLGGNRELIQRLLKIV